MNKPNKAQRMWGLQGDNGIVWAGRFKPQRYKIEGTFYWRYCYSVSPIEGSMNAKLIRVTVTPVKK